MWFSGLGDIARIGISGVVAFVALLASIRWAGNRTLSSMNASDFIVTVAMGTTFATTMLSTEVSIASGVAGIVTLVAIQALTVWTAVKYPRLRHRAEGEPVLLLHDGTPRTATMERARVSMDELRQDRLRSTAFSADPWARDESKRLTSALHDSPLLRRRQHMRPLHTRGRQAGCPTGPSQGRSSAIVK